MAERTFRNPKTGETMTFLKTARETNGELFRMGYTMAPHAVIADTEASRRETNHTRRRTPFLKLHARPADDE